MMRKLFLLVLIVTLMLSACSLLGDGETDDEATPTPATSTPIPPPPPPATAQVNDPDPAGPTVLNIWVVEDISLQGDVPGGDILAEQIAAFQTNRPDIEINVAIKAPSGQGGTLSYLRSGRNVAPSIMPDLIVLSAEQLETAAAEQLIYPLNELVVPSAFADLYTAAETLSQVGDQTYAYPFTLGNLTHRSFSTTVFTDTLPLTWDEMLEDDRASFTFPGAGMPGAELALQLYLAFDGALTSESGQPMLEVDPLASALTLILEGREDGLLPIQTTNMTVLEESWLAFNNGLANNVQTVESQYIVERENSPDSGFARLPGPQAPLTPMVKAWSWAISTPDPARQTLASDLLNWLIASPNMGDWSLAAGNLPARRSAFEQWPQNDEYIQFLQQELEIAAPYPYIVNGSILNAVSIALFDVLSLAKTPQQAAQEAVSSLTP